MWVMMPSFDQRTVSPTEIEMFSGLKNPTHRLGPSHRSTSPIDTTCVGAATVVLVVDLVVVVLELVVEVVVDGGAVLVVGLVEVVVVDSAVVVLAVAVVLVRPGTGSGTLVVPP